MLSTDGRRHGYCVRDSIYCGLEGHNTEEVPALIWVDQKKEAEEKLICLDWDIALTVRSITWIYRAIIGRFIHMVVRKSLLFGTWMILITLRFTSGEVFNLDKEAS